MPSLCSPARSPTCSPTSCCLVLPIRKKTMLTYVRLSARLRRALIGLALVSALASVAASTDEASFLDESDVAMTKMMTAMGITPSGNVDADFVAMMVPHHQGAIDMAKAQLRYGRNEQLRRLAQEIIVTQQQEIAVMQLALARPLAPSLSPSLPVTTQQTSIHPSDEQAK
jgi:hypothetical protein